MIYLCYAIMIVVPYLLCGINSAIIVTKIKTGEDIRTLGSGNAGLTNTLRTQGKLGTVCTAWRYTQGCAVNIDSQICFFMACRH